MSEPADFLLEHHHYNFCATQWELRKIESVCRGKTGGFLVGFHLVGLIICGFALGETRLESTLGFIQHFLVEGRGERGRFRGNLSTELGKSSTYRERKREPRNTRLRLLNAIVHIEYSKCQYSLIRAYVSVQNCNLNNST